MLVLKNSLSLHRQLIGILSQVAPPLENLIQRQLAEADNGGADSAQKLAFAALRFVTLYPDGPRTSLLTGVENLLLCKVSATNEWIVAVYRNFLCWPITWLILSDMHSPRWMCSECKVIKRTERRYKAESVRRRRLYILIFDALQEVNIRYAAVQCVALLYKLVGF